MWLGLAKVGVATALINFNQRKDVLQHSLDAVKANVIIYGTEYAQGKSIKKCKHFLFILLKIR